MTVAAYPFTALVGQEAMKLALVLNAVNPRLGGVLIRGEKGTAKSTAARGLAALLPPIWVVEGCRFGCDPQPGAPGCPECARREVPLPSQERSPAFVELPIGATEDRVLGTLDLEQAIQKGERHFDPGLLARANRGLLYVDEVNLLPDHLVDTLLDAAAMGTNTVEREGLSFSHPAAFVLVGTMNPEEGDLRPQLLDRFALAADVAGMPDPSERAEVVRRRVAFEADPTAFAEVWRQAERTERARIAAARECLPRVQLADHLLDLIARICVAFQVDGLRADVVMYKTAVTLAAYAARQQATVDDVRRAAELALPHRRRRQPFDQPGLDRERLEQLVREHLEQDDRDALAGQEQGHREDDQSEDEPPTGEPGPEAPDPPAGSSPEQVFEVGTSPPISAPPASRPGLARRIQSARRGRARVESPVGRHVRSLPFNGAGALDVVGTLHAAAPHQLRRDPQPPTSDPRRPRMRLQRSDLRRKVRQTADRWCTLFVVDASGSMAARRRMAAAKGAVFSLLLDAYQRRDMVGLVAFRGPSATLRLPPTNSPDLAYARLRDLPTGGRTPLAAALRLAHATLARQTARGLVVLVSDGRANVAVSGGEPHAEALAAAHALGAAFDLLVVDTEDGPVRLSRAHSLCEAAHGHYLRLGEQQPLAAAVRRLQKG